MRTVGVEEAAAVGSELLNDFLRGHWALSNGLLGDGVHHWLAVGIDRWFAIGTHVWNLLRFDQRRLVVGPQILHDALRDQNYSCNYADGQQHPQCRPHQVDPKVANGFLLTA